MAEGPLPAVVEAELIRGCPESGFSVGWAPPNLIRLLSPVRAEREAAEVG